MQRVIPFQLIYLCLIYVFSLFSFWNKSFPSFQFNVDIASFNWLNIIYAFGIDSISNFFVILCSFLLLVCLLLCWFWSYELSFFNFNIVFILYCLINLFFVKDIFLLFFFFELVILPLFLLVGIWGSRDRKIYASYLLIVYTLLGSIFAVFSFIIIYSTLGSSSSLHILNSNTNLDTNIQSILFAFIFLSFSVKVPVVPIHIWLPEAHVEAPTPGSVILAGIVLKLGFYVYLRALVFTFFYITSIFMSFIFVLSLVGLYMSSFAALAQVDMKKVVAYSSISHMNFSLIGLFSGNIIAIIGSFFMMFGHALVSGALFSSIGILYDRYKTRLFFYLGGFVLLMPLWSSLFFIFILGNFSLPGTINFVGEFVIFVGSFFVSNFVIIVCFIGLFITLIYSLFLYIRLANGEIRAAYIRYFADLTRREYSLLLPLVVMVIIFGVAPNIFIDYFFSNLYYYYMH